MPRGDREGDHPRTRRPAAQPGLGKAAAIRPIFDDRIEIISPGHLPNNLTVEKIRSGISNIRNPILVSYAAKGLQPYKGLGSGIKRALEDWPDISFTDDREGRMFIASASLKEPSRCRYRN
ncbi:MAG: hypothetical protein M0Q13_05690 [Methanothrix sp.]|nr:hypothetical protein [Methanothrix sp.]